MHEKGAVISIHEAPVREGYTFRYWKGSEYRPGDRYTVTEDHTFTAQWEKSGSGGGSGTNTGDGAHPLLWIVLALIAALETAVIMIRRRRKFLK